jgi:hypothetical protein
VTKRVRPDTFRQQRLTAALARHGISGGWREYLLACREQGMSAARIARHLARTFDLDLDDSTLTLWIKQAQQDADNQRGSERLLPGRPEKQ